MYVLCRYSERVCYIFITGIARLIVRRYIFFTGGITITSKIRKYLIGTYESVWQYAAWPHCNSTRQLRAENSNIYLRVHTLEHILLTYARLFRQRLDRVRVFHETLVSDFFIFLIFSRRIGKRVCERNTSGKY